MVCPCFTVSKAARHCWAPGLSNNGDAVFAFQGTGALNASGVPAPGAFLALIATDDPVVAPWIEVHVPLVDWLAPIVGMAVVVVPGVWLARRRRSGA